MGSDELVARCRTYAKDGQRALPSWARTSFRDCAHEIERLTAQLAEARESERAAVDRAWEQARDLVRGTNADMCTTAGQAYRIICGEMTNAVHNRQLRTLQGRVEARNAANQNGGT